MASSAKEPMSKRLFNPRSSGGPLPRHLQFLIGILCKRYGKANPGLNPKDGSAMGYWLKSNFTDTDIDWAHEQALNEYRGANRDRTILHDSNKDGKQGSGSTDKSKDMSTDELAKALDLDLDKSGKSGQEKREEDNEEDFDDDDEFLKKKEFRKHVDEEAKVILDLEEKITGEIQDRVNDKKFNAGEFAALNKTIREIQSQKPLLLEIKHPEIETRNIGIVHKNFPDLVLAANTRLLLDQTRLNIWMYGPAGTGKTFAAKKLGDALFDNAKYYESNSKSREEIKAQFQKDWSPYQYSPTLSSGFEVMGYNDAHGRYVSTPFYMAYKYGGVFLLDEIDGSMQDALLKLNGALSSTYGSFPCGMVERHPDCVILAGANTTGYGGDIEYLGTMKQNVAFLDRWSFLSWPHDDALENALVLNKSWLKRVRQVRKNAAEKKIKGHVITMRASMQGEALLASGFPQIKVEEMVLRKGLPLGTWNLISHDR